MASQQQAGSGPQSQSAATPEGPWMSFIRQTYPNLQTETYFFPPLYFNRVPQDVTTFENLTVRVTDNPPPPPPPSASRRQRQRRQPLPPPTPPPPQPPPPSLPPSRPTRVAGRVFTENLPDSQPRHVPQTDQKDDEAQAACLTALDQISRGPGNIRDREVMMVISNLKFRKYLCNKGNPLHLAAAALPTITDPSIPQQIADGECDVIIIHRTHGFILGEVKSVGGSWTNEDILRKVHRAVNQLDKQRQAVGHLLSDVQSQGINITTTLLLPNLTSGQLTAALAASRTDPQLQGYASLDQELRRVTASRTVHHAVSRCLCRDNMQQPTTWWSHLLGGGAVPAMTPHMYQRLCARFVGPATTVEIPTLTPRGQVLRTEGEAVAETGLRFSALTLTPDQVALLNTTPEPRFLYMKGPPGVGKTIVLLLKALQWARQGRTVILVNQPGKSAAVTSLLMAQLQGMLGQGACGLVIQQTCEFRVLHFDARAEVTSLQQQLRSGGPALVIVDEVPLKEMKTVENFIDWLTAVRSGTSRVTVWMAAMWDRQRTVLGHPPLPSWVSEVTLQQSLRCPPTVTDLVGQSDLMSLGTFIPQYTRPQLPVHTQGPPPITVEHFRQPGHTGGDDDQHQCHLCADTVVDWCRRLGVGQPGRGLQYRDLWILYTGEEDPHGNDVIVRRLQNDYPQRVHVVRRPLSGADTQELARAVTDHIIVVHSKAVEGLERRVVIVLGDDGFDNTLIARSRCTGQLIHIV